MSRCSANSPCAVGIVVDRPEDRPYLMRVNRVKQIAYLIVTRRSVHAKQFLHVVPSFRTVHLALIARNDGACITNTLNALSTASVISTLSVSRPADGPADQQILTATAQQSHQTSSPPCPSDSSASVTPTRSSVCSFLIENFCMSSAFIDTHDNLRVSSVV